MVQIRNTRTGEIKEINESEFGAYGIGQPAQQPAQMGTSVPQQGMGQGMGQGGMGSLENTLRALSLRQSLQKGDYKSALSLLSELKPEKEEQELGSSIQGGLSKIGEIRSILGEYEGEDVAGLSPSIKTKFFKGLSREKGMLKSWAPSEGTNLLQAAISEYNTRLFEIAGKAFTGPEKSLLEGMVLEVGDDELRLKDKMVQAEEMIKLKARNAGVDVPEITTKPRDEKDEPGEERTLLQKFVESETAPAWAGFGTGMIAAPATGGLGSIPAAGVGAGMTYALQDLLRPFAGVEQRQPGERLTEAGDEAKKAAVTRTIQVLLGEWLKGNLKPSKGLTGVRDVVRSKVPGTPVSGDAITEHVLQAAENAPATIRPTALKKVLNVISKFGGKNYSLEEAGKLATQAGNQAFKNEKLGKGAANLIENAIRVSIRNQTSVADPLTGYLTAASSKAMGIESKIGEVLRLLGRGITGKAASATGGYMLGKGF